MQGLLTHFLAMRSKAALCAQYLDTDKVLVKIVGLVLITSILGGITRAALRTFYYLTNTPQRYRVESAATTAIQLSFAALAISPWFTKSSVLLDLFAVCPFDVFDFAIEAAVYVLCVQMVFLLVAAALRISGAADAMMAATLSAVLLGVAVTLFREDTDQLMRYVFGIVKF